MLLFEVRNLGDKIVPLELENCPVCGGSVERDEVVPEKVQQVADVVDQPIEIREYRRGFYKSQIPHFKK